MVKKFILFPRNIVLHGRVKYFFYITQHLSILCFSYFSTLIIGTRVNINCREPEDISWLKISPVFALNYLGTLETVNFIISSLRETFVLARVGNRNFSSLSQYCGRCTYYLRRSWKRAKMPLNGHLRKPKTLLSPTVSLSFHEAKKALPMLLLPCPYPVFPPFSCNFSFLWFSYLREIGNAFHVFLHYCSLAWLTIATMLRLIVRVIVSSPSASTVIKYFVSTSVHASSSRFRKMRLWQFCLGSSLFVIYGCCFR